MATFEQFMEKWNQADDKVEFVRNRTPVIIDEENQAKVMEFIYQNVDDPWEYTSEIYKDFHKEFLEKIDPFIKDRIVWDLGSGIGSMWQAIQRPNFSPIRINCLESSKTAIEKAIKRNKFGRIYYHEMDLGLPEVYEPLFRNIVSEADVVFTMSFIYLLKASRRRELFKEICNARPKVIITSATRRDSEEEIFVFPTLDEYCPSDVKYEKRDLFFMRNPHAGGLQYTTYIYERV